MAKHNEIERLNSAQGSIEIGNLLPRFPLCLKFLQDVADDNGATIDRTALLPVAGLSELENYLHSLKPKARYEFAAGESDLVKPQPKDSVLQFAAEVFDGDYSGWMTYPGTGL